METWALFFYILRKKSVETERYVITSNELRAHCFLHTHENGKWEKIAEAQSPICFEGRVKLKLEEHNMIKENTMTPNEYQRLALRTASSEAMKNPLLNGLLGLGGETGECLDIYKKHLFQGHELDIAKVAKELGDVSWYLALTAYAIGYDLEDIFKMNIEKLRARYPDGFNANHSLHRKDGDI